MEGVEDSTMISFLGYSSMFEDNHRLLGSSPCAGACLIVFLIILGGGEVRVGRGVERVGGLGVGGA